MTDPDRMIRIPIEQAAAYIVDDASTDGMSQFLADRPTWWRRHTVHAEPLGWPQTLNEAAALAVDDGCDAVLVMRPGDWLRADAIEQMVRALQRCDAAVPAIQRVGGDNAVQVPPEHVTEADFADGCLLPVTALVRAPVWTALGGHHADIAGDWWARFHAAGYQHGVTPEPVIYQRISA